MKYRKNINTTKQDMKALLPVLAALCLIPLVVLTKDYQTEFSKFPWFNSTEIDQIDSFEYAKSQCVTILGIVAAVAIAVSQYRASRKKKPLMEGCHISVLVLCGVYAVMVILSSVFSKYSHLAFTGGGYGQWQTMWVLLAYVALFVYAYLFINTENRISVLIKCLMVTTGVIALLGVCQTAGNNPLSWGWMQKIITSQSKVNGIGFKEGVSNVILTFSNPNYVGPYIALILPVVAAFVTMRASKDQTKAVLCRIAGVLIAIGLLISLFGASSSAGAIAVAAGFAAFVLMLAPGFLAPKDTEKKAKTQADSENGKAKWKPYIVGGAALVVLLAAGFAVTKTEFFEKTVNKLLQGGEDTRNIASIVNSDQGLEVVLRNDEEFLLIPSCTNGSNVSFAARDSKDQNIAIEYAQDKKCYQLKDERFSMITLQPVNFSVEKKMYPGFRFNDAPNNITWTFMYVDNEWEYYSPFGKFLKLRKIDSFGFEDYQNIANRRGFIWSRSIPLLKKYWFTGVGPNAFIIAFPNDDFVGSKRVGGSTTLVDKPHNAILQIAIQTGGISAVAYAGLWILYMIGSVRLFWRKRHYTETERIGLGLMIGIFSFAVAGITNDTVVGSQYIYWILLGAGYAVNRLIKVKKEG